MHVAYLQLCVMCTQTNQDLRQLWILKYFQMSQLMQRTLGTPVYFGENNNIYRLTYHLRLRPWQGPVLWKLCTKVIIYHLFPKLSRIVCVGHSLAIICFARGFSALINASKISLNRIQPADHSCESKHQKCPWDWHATWVLFAYKIWLVSNFDIAAARKPQGVRVLLVKILHVHTNHMLAVSAYGDY